MLFTSRSEYAVFVLLDLAHLGRGVTALTREVAERRCLSPKFLSQIVSTLRAKGWIDTEPGPRGGISLRVDPRSVSVGDVVRATVDSHAVRDCVAPGGVAGCPTAPVCVLRPLWSRVQAAVDTVLAETTLADLLEAEEALAEKDPPGG